MSQKIRRARPRTMILTMVTSNLSFPRALEKLEAADFSIEPLEMSKVANRSRTIRSTPPNLMDTNGSHNV